MPRIASGLIAFSFALLVATVPTAAKERIWEQSDKKVDKLARRAVKDDPQRPGWFLCEVGAYAVTTDISSRFALRCAAYMEAFGAELQSLLRDKKNEVEGKPKLVVFSERRAYAAEHGDDSAGVYYPSRRTMYTFLQRERGEEDFATFNPDTIQHEGTHQFLHFMTGNGVLPHWFDEGFATIMEDWDMDKTKKENLAHFFDEHDHQDRVIRA